MTSQKIIVPEQAYRELLCGGDPQDIASRCEIGFPFERRDWLATVAGVQVITECTLGFEFDSRIRVQLIELSRLLNEMIAADIIAAKKRIDSMKDYTHG